ncbi:threonyl/alanyl tRNA synthetase [Aspergillus heteromorphus CBS 117.55]|uniref:Threonyl/alanyl tRNA synthetase n=1 Tax=Aspergillus heteromorphus CBS 117.55 TaxID=1448321 RepID=A0A317WD56_9EURO|nr:threonyl/alanyl tRNA synthetase [Aspergillus heteromorphus CBS 117.55]PWY82100.1 threonyl/alanyl tRNA synthetase [Aspergillus heteromorphus CBS 117.55]
MRPAVDSSTPNPPRTILTYQHDSTLTTHQTTLTSITPFPALSPANQLLFKQGTPTDYILTTTSTIFHPQGGGQPSDTGTMTFPSGTTFTVTSARMDAETNTRVLHLGTFPADSSSIAPTNGDPITQAIDPDQRLLFSRLHTAGHVLGSAVRHLVGTQIANFDELKASHFPDSASCEFQGLIGGEWKEGIQGKVDELVAADLPVRVEWWDEGDFRDRGLARLIPGSGVGGGLAPGEKWRVVNIVGAEVYPCGGTHVESTSGCGRVGVKKVSRAKGRSKVSYGVE